MIVYGVDTTNLFKYAAAMEQAQRASGARIAKTLNAVGDGVAREVRVKITALTGLTGEAVRAMVRTKPATRADLSFEIIVSDMSVLGEVSSRKLPRRGRAGENRMIDEFIQGQLVKVVTAGDGKVCPICEEIAEGSPYTIEEASDKVHHGAGIGQNECRCVLVPYVTRRQLQVSPGRGLGGGRGEDLIDERLTLRHLAVKVIDEAGHALRIRVS
jgi:hypothetical protein